MYIHELLNRDTKLLHRDTNLFKVFLILIESFQCYFVFLFFHNVVLLKQEKRKAKRLRDKNCASTKHTCGKGGLFLLALRFFLKI